MKASSVYVARSRALVANLLGTKNGTWIPWDRVIEVPLPLSSEIGQVVVDMLSHSNDEQEMPEAHDPRRRTLLERVGSPDWISFYVDVAMIVVEVADNRATITATVFDASGTPQPLGVDIACQATAVELGTAILEVASQIGRAMSTSVVHPSEDSRHPSRRLAPFGPKMAWLAIRSDDPNGVAGLLQLRSTKLVSWEDGIREAYEHGKTFVSAPMPWWTLAIGLPMPGAAWPSFQTWLTEVASHLPELHYYATQRVVDYHAWAKAVDKRWERIFVFAGGVVAAHGEVSRDERNLGLFRNQHESTGRAPLHRDPEESDVLSLARVWSVDPEAVVPSDSAGVNGLSGVIGRFA